MRASHSKKFSSLIGPAMIPSGGFKVNSANSLYDELPFREKEDIGTCIITS